MVKGYNRENEFMKKELSRILVTEALECVGKEVMFECWVDTKRDHGKLTFIDLRDRSGKLQCVGFQKMGELTTESVVRIVGSVKKRPEKMVNPDIATGTIEVDVAEYEVLNKASELPLQID